MRLPSGQDDLARHQRAGAFKLVRCQYHRPISGGDAFEHAVERRSTLRIETSVRLVEQQKARLADKRHSEGQPTALTGRELAMNGVGQRRQSELAEDRPFLGILNPRRARREPQILTDGQVVVTGGLVPNQADQPSVGSSVVVQVLSQDLG